MKKLIIAFAAVAMAVSVHAAQVAWKIQNVCTCDPSATPITTSTKVASGANYILALFYSADSTISATFDTGSIVKGDDTLITSFAPSSSGGTGSLGKKVDFDYSAGTYYYAVLFNSKGTTSASAFDYYAVSSTLTGNPVAVTPDTPLTLQWGTTSAAPTFTQAAPEPTSGLLLLLGFAGLALRRKQK